MCEEREKFFRRLSRTSLSLSLLPLALSPSLTRSCSSLSSLSQAAALDAAYPGGLAAYISRARHLLSSSLSGVNPRLEHWTPSVPAAGASKKAKARAAAEEAIGRSLEPGTDECCAAEAVGLEAAVGLGFVLLAGGLGERLGFSGTKLALPSEIATGMTVLGLYCAHILSLQAVLTARLGRAVRLPLAIMTSEDTHAHVLALLQANGHFGLQASQVGRYLALRMTVRLLTPFASLAFDPVRLSLSRGIARAGDVPAARARGCAERLVRVPGTREP